MDFGNGAATDTIFIANKSTFTKNNLVTHIYDGSTRVFNGYSGGGNTNTIKIINI